MLSYRTKMCFATTTWPGYFSVPFKNNWRVLSVLQPEHDFWKNNMPFVFIACNQWWNKSFGYFDNTAFIATDSQLVSTFYFTSKENATPSLVHSNEVEWGLLEIQIYEFQFKLQEQGVYAIANVVLYLHAASCTYKTMFSEQWRGNNIIMLSCARVKTDSSHGSS